MSGKAGGLQNTNPINLGFGLTCVRGLGALADTTFISVSKVCSSIWEIHCPETERWIKELFDMGFVSASPAAGEHFSSREVGAGWMFK